MTNKKYIIFFAALAAFLIAPFFLMHVSAQSCPPYVPSQLCGPYQNGAGGINTLIHNVIEFIFAIAGLVVLIFIIFAGFKFITSGGDAGKKEEAQKQIVAAVIGLLIIVFSFFIVQLIFSLLGLGSATGIELPCGITTNDQPTPTNCLGTDTPTQSAPGGVTNP